MIYNPGVTKREIIEVIYQQYQESQSWISSVPIEIQHAFFDNPYVASRGKIIQRMMSYIFTDEEYQWVDWLTLEWDYNPHLTITIDGVTYRFNTFEEGLDKLFELGLIKENTQ